MSSRPTVAIAGASGRLGSQITEVLLSPEHLPSFCSVILLTRRAPHPIPEVWSAAKVVEYDENDLSSALSGVDVLINTIGSSGHAFKENLLRALPKTSVKLYIPSEFGVDHRAFDFTHAEWSPKQAHAALAAEILPQANIRMCRVFVGLLLEDSIGPWFGFFTKENKYQAVGSRDALASYTSMRDVGRVVASLAAMNTEIVPGALHVGGDTQSIARIARIMENAGAEKITVDEIDIDSYRAKVVDLPEKTPEKALRFLMGEGKINHTSSGLGSDNEMVNPGQKIWKWKSLADLAKETNGRPWADAN